MEIIKYNSYKNIDIRIDDLEIKNVSGKTIKEIKFERLFYSPDYFYNIGDIINSLIIIEQIQITNNKYK